MKVSLSQQKSAKNGQTSDPVEELCRATDGKQII